MSLLTPEQMNTWKKFIELHSVSAGFMGWTPQPPTTTEPQPHPLEPKPEKKCTCGAVIAGSSGHSNWCDAYEPANG